MARGKHDQEEVVEEVRHTSAPYYKFGPAKGKRLLKVCSNPATWVEINSDATEEEMAKRIADYKEKNPSLTESLKSIGFDELKEEAKEEKHTRSKFDYTGPIYSIPKVHSHMIK